MIFGRFEKFPDDLKDASSDRLDGGISKVSYLLSECFDFEKNVDSFGRYV